jgi:hypothetical protein
MNPINAQPVQLVLQNTVGAPAFYTFDSAGALANAVSVKLTVMTMGGNTLTTDDISVIGTRITNPAVGTYRFAFGDILPNNETNLPGDFIFQWNADDNYTTQVVKVVTPCTMRLIPYFRLLVDKSAKHVKEDPVTPCFLGYTDAQLVMYLEQGLGIINAYEPYPIFLTLDTFPDAFRHLLLESALIAGVLSQQLFAIDEDVPSFNDQGNSFVIQHAPQLASLLNQITARLDKLIPQMKLKFVQSGSVHVQAGGNFRLAQLVSAAPSGALFRNMFFSG